VGDGRAPLVVRITGVEIAEGGFELNLYRPELDLAIFDQGPEPTGEPRTDPDLESAGSAGPPAPTIGEWGATGGLYFPNRIRGTWWTL
jgi:hypothetical protein